jgi:hypothetical protein
MRLRFRVDVLFGRGIESSVSRSGMDVTGLPSHGKCPDSKRGKAPSPRPVADNFGRDRRGIASGWREPTSAQDVLYKDPFPITVHSVAPQIVIVVRPESSLFRNTVGLRRWQSTDHERSSGAPSPGVLGAALGKADTMRATQYTRPRCEGLERPGAARPRSGMGIPWRRDWDETVRARCPRVRVDAFGELAD